MKIQVTVVHPTQRADNSNLPLSQLARWRLRYSTSGMGAQVNGPDMPMSATVAEIDGVSVGHPVAIGQDWNVVVDWFDTDGQQSALGLPVTVTAPAPPPLPALPKAGTASYVILN